MATYIMLGNFTEQGIRAVKDTTKRAEALNKLAKKTGVTVKAAYWLLGEYDVCTIIEAPDDEAMSAFGLSVGVLGNVRTKTLRALTADEMTRVLGRLA
jgi:uncharacterized protein with GYD domain